MKRRTLSFFSFVLLLVIATLSAGVLSACSKGDSDNVPSSEGYSLSGKITANGAGLADVDLYLNGEPVAETDSNGVFSLVGLSYGDVVAFAFDGYSFSPDSHTVKSTVNDLDVRAFPKSPEDVEGDDGEQDGDPPAQQDGEDDEEQPRPPERLPSPSLSVVADESETALVVVADKRATAFTLSVDDDTAVTVPFASSSFVLGGKIFALSATDDGNSHTVVVNLSPLDSDVGAAYTLAVSVSAQGCLPSEEARTEIVFPPAAAAFLSLSFDSSSLSVSWTTSNLPDGCRFVVYANGVLLGTASSSPYSLTGILPAGEYALTVAALCDGVAVAFSPAVTVTMP